MTLNKVSRAMLLDDIGDADNGYDRGVSGSIMRRPAFDLIIAPDTVHAREFVNCDGTDEAAGLQAAFNAAKNRRLILPAGVIKFGAPIVLDPLANYVVEGQGYSPNGNVASVLRNIGTDPANSHGIICNDGSQVGVDNCREFRNFMLFGNQFSGHGMVFSYAQGFKVEKMLISTHGGHGIWAYRSFSSSIENSIVTHCGKYCIFYEEIANNILMKRVTAINGSRSGGYGNIRVGATSLANANLGVEIAACDWTGPGTFSWSGGVDPLAVGLILQYVYGAAIHGNYAEVSPNLLTYIAGNCQSVDFRGNYQQDGVLLVENGAKGVIVEANNFQKVSGTTTLNGASSQSANGCRYFGNTMIGGATQSLAA